MKLYRALIPVLGLLAACLTLAAAQPEVPPITEQCREDLAQRLNQPVAEVTVEEVKAVTFPDGSLGLSRPGEMYTQALAPGHTLILKARNRKYLYTAGAQSFRYGGPLAAWQYSALYIESIPEEPNLNGNLVQVSLAGTNPRVLLAEVSDFWPQPDGGLLAKRRTSRSGHDLLYRPADPDTETLRLGGALDYAAAAVNPEKTHWAALHRPRLGADWELVTAPLAEGNAETPLLENETADVKHYALPADTRPEGLWWDEEGLVALLTTGEIGNYYRLTEEGGWRLLARIC